MVMENVLYINYPTSKSSFKVYLKEIRHKTFYKYINNFPSNHYMKVTISPTYKVLISKNVEEYMSPPYFLQIDIVDDEKNKPAYHNINILGNELRTLIKYWCCNADIMSDYWVHVQYIGNNIDRLINEATIKNIIE